MTSWPDGGNSQPVQTGTVLGGPPGSQALLVAAGEQEESSVEEGNRKALGAFAGRARSAFFGGDP